MTQNWGDGSLEIPLRRKGGINLYAYVHNNPISFIDPRGLASTQMPDGWQKLPCSDLAALIIELRNALAKRLQDLRADKNNLYNNPNPPPNSGTWKGHQQMFEQTQKQLQNVLDLFNSKGCGDPIPADAAQLASIATPTQPAPKPSWFESNRDAISNATGLSAAGATVVLVTYLIVSEGSRAFPPRNLVPVP